MRRLQGYLTVLGLNTALGATSVAQVIDYHSSKAWLARPGIDSAAGLVPRNSGYRNLQAYARADAAELLLTIKPGDHPP